MALPTNEKVWMGGGAIAALLIAAVAWMLLISPERSSASSLREETVSAQDQNNILRIKLAKLRKDNANLPKLAAEFKDVRAGLPTASAMTTFTRQLTAEATAHQLSLGGITVSSAKSVGAGGVTTTATTATGFAAGAHHLHTAFAAPVLFPGGLDQHHGVGDHPAVGLQCADVRGPGRSTAEAAGQECRLGLTTASLNNCVAEQLRRRTPDTAGRRPPRWPPTRTSEPDCPLPERRTWTRALDVVDPSAIGRPPGRLVPTA
jgi:hypothetical protein